MIGCKYMCVPLIMKHMFGSTDNIINISCAVPRHILF